MCCRGEWVVSQGSSAGLFTTQPCFCSPSTCPVWPWLPPSISSLLIGLEGHICPEYYV